MKTGKNERAKRMPTHMPKLTGTTTIKQEYLSEMIGTKIR